MSESQDNAGPKHTAGPWEWRSPAGCGAELVARHSGTLLVLDAIAEAVHTDYRPIPSLRFAQRAGNNGGLMVEAGTIDLKRHPDARLIAAAPDLLAACRAVLDLKVIPHSGKHGVPALVGLVIRDAEAAIAKAEGH